MSWQSENPFIQDLLGVDDEMVKRVRDKEMAALQRKLRLEETARLSKIYMEKMGESMMTLEEFLRVNRDGMCPTSDPELILAWLEAHAVEYDE